MDNSPDFISNKLTYKKGRKIIMDCEIQKYWEGTECAGWGKEGMSHLTSSHLERGHPDWAGLQLLNLCIKHLFLG